MDKYHGDIVIIYSIYFIVIIYCYFIPFSFGQNLNSPKYDA